mmetsp:Transcript_49082/g.116896  ORF Transcript_49082/g.116896 Transcript_49082/m.116896 type:complete len:213 (+) Transcript_49082:142-780(+)
MQLGHQLLVEHEHQCRVEHGLQEFRLNASIQGCEAAHDHHFDEAVEDARLSHPRCSSMHSLSCLSNLERVSCAGSHGLRDCAGNEGIGRGNLCLSLEEVPLQQVVDDKLNGRVGDQQHRRGHTAPEGPEALLDEDEAHLLPEAIASGTPDLQPRGGYPEGSAQRHSQHACQARRHQVRHARRQLPRPEAGLHVGVCAKVDEVGEASRLKLAA